MHFEQKIEAGVGEQPGIVCFQVAQYFIAGTAVNSPLLQAGDYIDPSFRVPLKAVPRPLFCKAAVTEGIFILKFIQCPADMFGGISFPSKLDAHLLSAVFSS
jgi:hypothetical protein